MNKPRAWLGTFLAVACITAESAPGGVGALDSLAITVHGSSRAFVFTNKETAFLYGETTSGNTSGWQGFNVEGHEFLDDYSLTIDGMPLDRSKARTTVYPDFLRRVYSGGITEEVHPLDTVAGFIITVSAPRPVEVGFVPLFADARSADDLYTALATSAILVARRDHLHRTRPENYPVWVAAYGAGFVPVLKSTTLRSQYSPAMLLAPRARTRSIGIAVGDTREGTDSLARSVSAAKSLLEGYRRKRMEVLLKTTAASCSEERYAKALAWAQLSLDALIMNQGSHGIFAGLPWFNNYWGRDTFIALPGAVLVTGRMKEARILLRSFAAFQQRDSLSSDFGRIPNIVTPTDTAYNTADATPRFVNMVREYVERSGDRQFLLEMYPTILRATDGTIRYHCDSLGFLTHTDADTWMDAVGPDGPWSPRGNRANDIQALWFSQLEAAVGFATTLGDVTSARRWHGTLQHLRTNFKRLFITSRGIADRILPDGTPDMSLRPNQMFTSPLLDDSIRTAMVQTVVSRLTYAYGVSSLSQDDENFHPYHVYPPYYPKDAAYHNGTVWTWLQGVLISELCRGQRTDLAYRLTEQGVHQILDRGAVGTMPELLDAMARPGEQEPRLSGTVSQAWSLAEFVRNFYEDFLGITYHRLDRSLWIDPHIPAQLRSLSTRVNVDGTGFTVRVDRTDHRQVIDISYRELPETLQVHTVLRTSDASWYTVTFPLPPHSDIAVTEERGAISVQRHGSPWPHTTDHGNVPATARLDPSLDFAHPMLHEGLPSLRGPDFPLLDHETIVRTNPLATMLLDATDPATDDTGRGSYTYPLNRNFVPGSFDIRRLSLAEDSAYAYFSLTFRTLSNPGWHPEYGFQLTFAAIAIDEDGIPHSGKRSVGRNALYELDEDRGFEKIIYIGGGLRLEDGRGRVLAAYIPVEHDAARPFGNAATGTVRFAIPLSILGRPSGKWTFIVLAGAQDDHGGAGLGEFRTVNRERGEWNGGGKSHPDDPNIYDTLIAQPRR